MVYSTRTGKHPELPPGCSPADIDRRGKVPDYGTDDCRECGKAVPPSELYRNEGECDDCAAEPRWIAWVRESTVHRVEKWVSEHRMTTTAMDIVQGDIPQYATKFHLAPKGVGWYADQGEGEAGATLCGVDVPEDVPGVTVRMWLKPDTLTGGGIDRCKRCQKIAGS